MSVFTMGDTIPLSFVLRRADGSLVMPNDTPRWITPIRGARITAKVNESVPSAPGSTGSAYSWRKDRWQYDWSTKKLTAGYECTVGVQLDDGTTRTVTIALH